MVQIDSSDVIEKKILENELDLSVIEGNIHSDYIAAQEIYSDRLIAVCSTLRYHKDVTSLSIKDFAKEKFLLRAKNSGIYELFSEAMHLKGYDIDAISNIFKLC